MLGESVFETDRTIINGELRGGIRILAEVAGAEELEGSTGFGVRDDFFGVAAADLQALRVQAGDEILLVDFFFLILAHIVVQEGIIQAGLKGDAVPGGHPVQGLALDLAIGTGTAGEGIQVHGAVHFGDVAFGILDAFVAADDVGTLEPDFIAGNMRWYFLTGTSMKSSCSIQSSRPKARVRSPISGWSG